MLISLQNPAMRSSVVYISLLLYSLLSSCAFKEKQEAQAFYDRVHGMNDTFTSLTNDWYALLDTAKRTNDYAILNPKRIQLGIYIADTRSAIANFRVTRHNEKIKVAEEAFLSGQSAKVAEIYPLFERYSGFTPREVIKISLKQLGDDRQHAKRGIDSINMELDKYAKYYTLKPYQKNRY